MDAPNDNAPSQAALAAKQAIGERLKATRQMSGLNQRDFA
ncbi:MAG: transcriptional regulator, partial [Herbaspirillum sp.]|nr:transcriptional regulator [Herbaspirillum sp.]